MLTWRSAARRRGRRRDSIRSWVLSHLLLLPRALSTRWRWNRTGPTSWFPLVIRICWMRRWIDLSQAATPAICGWSRWWSWGWRLGS